MILSTDFSEILALNPNLLTFSLKVISDSQLCLKTAFGIKPWWKKAFICLAETLSRLFLLRIKAVEKSATSKKIKSNNTLIVIHDSILPTYRGYLPLVSQLIDGQKEIGVTAILANENFDEGDIVHISKTKINYPITINDAIIWIILISFISEFLGYFLSANSISSIFLSFLLFPKLKNEKSCFDIIYFF